MNSNELETLLNKLPWSFGPVLKVFINQNKQEYFQNKKNILFVYEISIVLILTAIIGVGGISICK